MSSQNARFCAIDFGTSNSSVAIPVAASADARAAIELVPLEDDATSMPTAVFFSAEDDTRLFGRAAVRAYVDGNEGRLMRSIKSILGSDLMERTTEVGLGVTVKYLDVVIAYLRRLKQQAETHVGARIDRAVIGRPVFFVDGDPARDIRAQATLAEAAAVVGFKDVTFQFEPIAAALDFERTVTKETLVLVADIGGGTSDFSIVRVGPRQRVKTNRSKDILANHGVHVAGTDFDREVNVAAIMPQLGLGAAQHRGVQHRGTEQPVRGQAQHPMHGRPAGRRLRMQRTGEAPGQQHRGQPQRRERPARARQRHEAALDAIDREHEPGRHRERRCKAEAGAGHVAADARDVHRDGGTVGQPGHGQNRTQRRGHTFAPERAEAVKDQRHHARDAERQCRGRRSGLG